MKISKPRGTIDLFGDEISYFEKVTDTLRMIAKIYCYNEIVTPMFESKELFISNIGESTDIVTKELYEFLDKGDRLMSLRPEGTLPVIRSVIENKLIYKLPHPLKFFYYGPMFRYERPQSGRQRQFHQFGVECISIKNICQQVDLILLGLNILNTFKISKFILKVNYIGSLETRTKWINELKIYFRKHKKELSDDSIARIETNPLRILDDKIDSKKKFVVDAPKVDKFLTPEETKEKKELLVLLDSFKINYYFDNTIVRGLDYYSGLVFEFISTLDILNNQSTLIGGGKYENIFSKMDEDNVPCIGFALGIERLILAIKNESPFIFDNSIDIYFANLCKEILPSFFIINLLRNAGFSTDGDLSIFKLDKHFKCAQKSNSKIILIFGEKEKLNESIIIKFQNNKEEKKIKIDQLLDFLFEQFNKKYLIKEQKQFYGNKK